MLRSILGWLVLVLGVTGGAWGADAVYYNGKIVTVWDEKPVVSAVAIRDGRFVTVGSDEEALALAGPETRKVDLEGKTVVPGLIDSHVHPISAGLAERYGVIPVMRSHAEIREYVERARAETPPDKLIFLPKVYSTRMKEQRYPTCWEMDEFSGEHVVMLDNGYASQLNSAALRAAGINSSTPDPENGKIIRKAGTREPTGLILGARQLVAKLVQQRAFTDEDRLWALRKMQQAYNAAGLTSVIDGAQRADGLRLYQRLWRNGEMTVRTSITMFVNAEEPIDVVKQKILDQGLITGFGDDMMRIGPLKFSLDGGILIGTAFLRAPYGPNTEVYGFDDPDYRGEPRIPREKAIEIVKFANQLGWRVTAHQTGGAATDILLDAFEAANEEKSIRDRRFNMIHSNFPDPAAIQRAKKLGAILDMQIAWYHFDGPALSKVLGPTRMKNFHPYRSIFDAGVVVAGGSDHMIKFDSREAVNPFHPFYGMWMAITRKTTEGTVFHPEERITREEALRMWTINGAYNSLDEKVKGSIEPGKLADLVVISKDYLTCPEDEIKEIEALTTVVGGNVVYQR
jgi:predicted amidohydrolase YtcJ